MTQLRESDLHPHLKTRMEQRGVTLEEVNDTLDRGWEAADVRPGTLGRVLVIPFQAEWEGRRYEEKEVTVYYKMTEEGLIVLTVKARYGSDFPRGGSG